jgi:hypothetical protein
MKAAQMSAEGKISFEIICVISGNQREYLRKSAGKMKENLPQIIGKKKKVPLYQLEC